MKRIAFALLALLAAAGCASNEIGHSKDVNQDEINQSFFVVYDGAKDETTITAFFRFAGENGTTLILDEPSTYTFDGEAITKTELASRGCFYEKVIKGKLPQGEHTFVFTDINNKTYTNKFKWFNIDELPVPDSISKGDNLKVKFDGFKDRPNEKLTVEVSDTANTVSETFDRVGLDDKVAIQKDKLQTLNGDVTINVQRTGRFDLKQHAHAGGFIYTEYTLAEHKAVMVP